MGTILGMICQVSIADQNIHIVSKEQMRKRKRMLYKEFLNDRNSSRKTFRENKESKHWRNAMYGWYRYDSRFAIPVYRDDEEVERYNIFMLR